MVSAVRNCIVDLQCTIQEAINMASSTPATFLGLQQQKGYLAPGCDADWVVFTDQYYVNATYIAGEQVSAQTIPNIQNN